MKKINKSEKISKKSAKNFLKSLATMLALSIGLSGCDFSTDEYDEEHRNRLTETQTTTTTYQDYEEEYNHEHEHHHDGEYAETVTTPTIEDEDLSISEVTSETVTTTETPNNITPNTEETTNSITEPHQHSYSLWSSLNDSQEYRECNCGDVEYRSHDFASLATKTIINENGHTLESVLKCTTCDYEKTYTKEENHSFNNWQVNEDYSKSRVCEICGFEETKDHTHSYSKIMENYIINDTGHTVEEVYECTECQERISKIQDEEHEYSEYRMLNDEKEYRVCLKDGHPEFKNHEFGKWIDNGDGTETRECKTCEASQTREKEEDITLPPEIHYHTYGAWKAFDDNYEYRECYKRDSKEYRPHSLYSTTHYSVINDMYHSCIYETACHTCDYKKIQYVELEEHNYIPVSSTANYETYKCYDCGHEMTKNINPQVHTHIFGSWTYDEVNNQDVRKCLDNTCNYEETHNHTHNYGQWEYLDEFNEQRICDTLYADHIETQSHNYSDYVYDPETEKEISICSSCHDKKIKNHEHEYGNWIAISDTEHTRTCLDDPRHNETKTHNFTWVNNEDNTLSIGTCNECSYQVEKDITPEHEHVFGEWISYNDDYEYRDCKDKDFREYREHSYEEPVITYEAIDDNKHYEVKTEHCKTCNHDKITKTEVLHTFAGWTVDPANNKKEINKCTTCGHEISRDIICAHDSSTWIYNETTQTDDLICSDCNELISSEPHNHSYSSWVSNGVTEEIATCDNGKTTHNATRSHTISITNGTPIYNNDGTHTLTEIHTCSTCDYTETINSTISPCGGTWQYNPTSNLEEKTCPDCNHTETRTHLHSFGEWTIKDENNEEATCSICNQTETRPHDYVIVNTSYVPNSNNSHNKIETYQCTRDGQTKEVITENISCEFGDWQYDANLGLETRTCSLCHNQETQIHNHQYGEYQNIDEYGAKKVCSICGDELLHTHNFDSFTTNADGVNVSTCTECGYSKEQSCTHEYEPVGIPQHTYQINGPCKKVTMKCKHCGDTYEEEYQNHNWIEWEPGNYYCEYCNIDATAKQLGYSTQSEIHLTPEDKELLAFFEEEQQQDTSAILSREDQELLAFFEDKKSEPTLTLRFKR